MESMLPSFTQTSKFRKKNPLSCLIAQIVGFLRIFQALGLKTSGRPVRTNPQLVVPTIDGNKQFPPGCLAIALQHGMGEVPGWLETVPTRLSELPKPANPLNKLPNT